MNLFALFREDRRLQILALAALVAVILGFVAIPPDQALALMTAGGYWAMLGTFSWFLWSLWRLMRDSGWKPGRPASGSWKIPLLIGACGCLLLVHERYGFKILMDEIMLLGTSM